MGSLGDVVVSGSHDRSLRRWERTEEPFFVEEEKEKRLESLFEADLEVGRRGDAGGGIEGGGVCCVEACGLGFRFVSARCALRSCTYGWRCLIMAREKPRPPLPWPAGRRPRAAGPGGARGGGRCGHRWAQDAGDRDCCG